MADEKAKNGSGGQRASYQVLGYVFGLLGLVLLLGTDSRAAGLPFLVLGVTFFLIGRKDGRSRSSGPGSKPGSGRD